jgi:glyoxylate reductase
MPKKKPYVVVTRRLPELIETRMRELFDAHLNLDDEPMAEAEIVEAKPTCWFPRSPTPLTRA